jgi:uncharacterized membrane protein YeaQ/YmgE (transglycosylase-associated protein family)
MTIIIYLVVAAVIGWVATEIMHDRSNLWINIVVAVVGAFIAGWLLTPLLGIPTINQGSFSLPSLLVSLAGSIILLAVVHFIRRRR